MSFEMAFVIAVLVIAFFLFVTERYPIDQVALAIPVVLLLAGVLNAEEALAGFSSPATVTVAAMLVLGLGLAKTGAVEEIGRWARTAPLGTPMTRLLLLCVGVAALSPFLNNTVVVVIFIPVFLGLAQQAQEAPSRYLMPLSFSAILGGTVTLMGTSTNLVVWGLARERGYLGLHAGDPALRLHVPGEQHARQLPVAHTPQPDAPLHRDRPGDLPQGNGRPGSLATVPGPARAGDGPPLVRLVALSASHGLINSRGRCGRKFGAHSGLRLSRRRRSTTL